jgi:fused signal recognition particle receptor
MSDDLIWELEEALFTADIGVATSQRLLSVIHSKLKRDELKDPQQVWRLIKDEITSILNQGSPPLSFEREGPTVIMVVGVNGAGKTTSIGKLAHRYVSEGKRVVLAAGDTFRAAAVDQLERWAERAGVSVVRGRDGQDPSSVAFDACRLAAEQGADVVIIDTAGRLQARVELMDELAKVHRVIGKAIPQAPHEVWLVLDATNGQNAISQAKIFTERVAVSGIVLTKLDGTAKGGVIIGIKDEMRIPIRYIGVGERTVDLQVFDARAFTAALFDGVDA